MVIVQKSILINFSRRATTWCTSSLYWGYWVFYYWRTTTLCTFIVFASKLSCNALRNNFSWCKIIFLKYFALFEQVVVEGGGRNIVFFSTAIPDLYILSVKAIRIVQGGRQGSGKMISKHCLLGNIHCILYRLSQDSGLYQVSFFFAIFCQTAFFV